MEQERSIARKKWLAEVQNLIRSQAPEKQKEMMYALMGVDFEHYFETITPSEFIDLALTNPSSLRQKERPGCTTFIVNLLRQLVKQR